MGPQRRIALVLGTVALTVAALPAGALAFGANGGQEQGNVTVPAGGTGGIHTDNLPPKVDQGTIDMENQEAATTDTLIDVAFALSEIPTPSRRIVACALMTYGNNPAKEVVTLTQSDPSLQLLFFAICIQLAQRLPPRPSVAADMARASGPACSEQRTAVPVKITRSGRGYRAVVNGSTFTPRTRSKVIVTCRRKGGGLLISVKPRKRGQSLRQAVGPTLGVGIANLGKKPAPIRATFTVK